MKHQATFSEISLEPSLTEEHYGPLVQIPARLTFFSDPGRHTEVLEVLLYGSADDFENLSDWARDCARARRR